MQVAHQSAAPRGTRRTVLRVLVGLLLVAGGTLGLSDPAAADAIPGGKLFAGGVFTQAGATTATNIAAWDGGSNTWSALVGPNGEGTDSQVSAMTMYNGKLIAGGSFLNAGGEVVSGIASWSGTDWEPLVGSNGAIGVSILPIGFVSSVTVYNGDLYVGGLFQRAGGQVVNNIARWNGTDWFPLPGTGGTVGTDLGGSSVAPVWDLTTVDGQLIVAGEFTSAGGVAVNSVAAWNGTSWSSAGQPLAGVAVLAAENYNGRLVVGRSYSENNLAVRDVAWRDSGVWSVLGPRLDGDVRDLTNFNGLLIAGGAFTSVGTTTVNHIAAWNGSAWSGLSGPAGTGTDNSVFAVTAHWGFLFAGGFFTSAGGQAASHIARWNGSAWSAVPGGGTDGDVFELLST